MFNRLHSGIDWAAVKSWLAPAGLLGAGLLPCPGCGAPMIMHFWPVALVLTLVNLRRHRRSTCDALHDDPSDHATTDSGPE